MSPVDAMPTTTSETAPAALAGDVAFRPPRIVIVGGGFAGAYCARELERRLAGRADVRLVDRRNFLLFYPLLIEAGTGSLEPRHTTVSLRRFLRRTHYVQAELESVDPRARVVRVRPPGRREALVLGYDHLVLALGATTRLPPVPGLAEHGHPVRTLADALALRNRVIALLEQAQTETRAEGRRALLHVVVVGANLTGAEVAGELDVLLRRATGRAAGYAGADDIALTLVERDEHILRALDPALAAYAARNLASRGIRILTGRTVTRIAADACELDDGTRLATHMVVWCAGIAPPPILANLPVPRDENGWVRCTPDLRVEGHERLWAIGDCAHNPGPDGRPFPATAQHAIALGRHLAHNLARVLADGSAEPCRVRGRGTIAALGCRTAVAEVLGVRLSGFAAWWLWRTVYLLRMPGLGRKLRVALDWTMNLLFPPEIIQLDLRSHGFGALPAPGDVPRANPEDIP